MANWQRVGLASAVALTFLGIRWVQAEAQMVPTTAEVVSATGQVEAQRKGQAQWAAIGVGGKLAEGDHVRALARSSAELKFADGSTVLVAENSRFAVVKTDYDGNTGGRNMAGHLVAGKIRAQVAKAGVQLVAARQAGFNISTPNGVAAVRGTIVIVAFNPATGQTLVVALPSPGQAAQAAIVSYVNRTGQAVTIQGGQQTTHTGTGVPGTGTSLSPAAQAALQTASNVITANAPELTIVVPVPNFGNLLQLIQAAGLEAVVTGGGGPPSTGDGTSPCPGCGRDVTTGQ